MLRSISKHVQSGQSVESVLEEEKKKKATAERICRKGKF